MQEEVNYKYKDVNKKMQVFFVAAILISTGVASALFLGSTIIGNESGGEGTLNAKIFADTTSGYPPFEVNFSSIVTGRSGKLSYHWDFGDGQTSTEPEPVHVYNGNESYLCELTVTAENGKKSVDSVVILPKNNRAPRASIDISSTAPERKFKFSPSYLILRSATKSYGGRYLYYLKKFGIAPMADEKSTIHASALVSDPEGDEIVSYDWELRGPTITLFGMQQYHPIYTYSGKNVTFDLLDTYVAGKYDLKLKITDEAGNIDSEIITFQVEENPTESQTFGLAKFYKDTWLKQLSGIDGVFGLVAGGIGFLFYKNAISKKLSFPLVKLTLMFILSTLKLSPDDYGNETMTDVMGQVLDKWSFLKPVTKNVLDMLEKYFIKIGVNDTAESLQITEEQLGLDNNRPVISKPYPKLDEDFVDRNSSRVFVTVKDIEGDPFEVTISGDYINDVTYSNDYNGTYSATIVNPLPANEEIIWTVKVIDSNNKPAAFVDSDDKISYDSEYNFKFTTAYE